MKTVFALAATALALAATPALADAPVGPRIEALAGYDKVSADVGGGLSLSRDGFGFALNVGYDFALSSSVSAGIDAEVGDSTTKLEDVTVTVTTGRDLYVGGRLTAAVTPSINVYAKAGYTNARLTATSGGLSASENGDGVRLGLGTQIAFSGPFYGLVEYRYSNYESDVTRNQVMAGVGLRF